MDLLDVNILLALGDSTHPHHQRARNWFLSPEREVWATCPLTENGFIRIAGHSSYKTFPGGSTEARAAMDLLTSNPGHQFWADDLSLRDLNLFPNLPGSKHLTDLYLLALAVSHEGRFATLDERIDPGLVPGGKQACFILPK